MKNKLSIYTLLSPCVFAFSEAHLQNKDDKIRTPHI